MRHVFLVIAVGLVGCTRNDSAPTPTTAPMPVTATAGVDAAAARAEPVADAPPSPRAAAASARITWFMHNVTSDGTMGLLERQPGPGSAAKRPFHLRTVDVATNKVVEDADLEAIADLPRETIDDGGRVRRNDLDRALHTPELAADLVKAAKIVGRFPLGAGGRIAATKDGAVIAFNAGDWIYVADGAGKVKRRVAEQASYRPRFSPDGKWLFFDKNNGPLDKVVSKYELFVVPSDLSAPPKRIDGTAEMRDQFVVAPDGTMRGIVSYEPIIKTCMVSVTLAPPFTAKNGPCFAAPNGSSTGYVLSPTGAWAAITSVWDTKDDDPQRRMTVADGGVKILKKQEWAVRALRVADGKSFLVDTKPGKPLLAINDDGVLLRTSLGQSVTVEDVPNGTSRDVVTKRWFGGRNVFRTAKELVFEEDGVKVVDIDTLR